MKATLTSELKKSEVRLSGQVEFSAGQVTSHSHLPEGQGGSSLSTKMLKK